jgi:WD40 repeat protein
VTADGKWAVSAFLDNTLKVWDLASGLPIATFHCDSFAECCAFSGNKAIVAGDAGGKLYFLSLEEPATRDGTRRQ